MRGNPGVPTLIKHGVNLLEQFQQTDAKRTEVLRDLAKVVVTIRSKFTTGEGKAQRPDWAGQSAEYRAAIKAMYDEAGIDKDRASNVQAALRYHVGNVLREVASSKELTSAGLATEGPRDRALSRATDRADARAASPVTTTTDEPTTPDAAIHDAILRVQFAGSMPPPADPSDLILLLLSLEHQCQQVREMLQANVPTFGLNKSKGAPAKARAQRTKQLQAA